MLWTFPTTCSLLSFLGKDRETENWREWKTRNTHISLVRTPSPAKHSVRGRDALHSSSSSIECVFSRVSLSLKSIKHVQLMWMCVRALFPVNKLVKWEERREIEAMCVYVTQDFSLRLHCLSGVYHIPHCRGVQCVTCCLPITSVIPRYRGWGEIHFLR